MTKQSAHIKAVILLIWAYMKLKKKQVKEESWYVAINLLQGKTYIEFFPYMATPFMTTESITLSN